MTDTYATEEEIADYLAARLPNWRAFVKRLSSANPSDADDLLQEGLLAVTKALRTRPRKADGYYTTTLRMTVVGIITRQTNWTSNQKRVGGFGSMDVMRKGVPMKSIEAAAESEDEEDGYDILPALHEVGYGEVDQRDRVARALAHRPESERQLALHVIEGETIVAAAKLAGVSRWTGYLVWPDIKADLVAAREMEMAA